MSRGKVITINDELEIISKYVNDSIGVESLSRIYGVGKLKIKDILTKNNISIKIKGGQIKDGNTKIIINAKTKIYNSGDVNKKLIAICKKTNEKFEDVNNLSGCLTNHIIKTYDNVSIPRNTYQRKKYELDNDKKWFEEYFDIVEVNKNNARVCKICGWETEDVLNKSGCFENHLSKVHNKSIGEYLKLYSEDKVYHKKYTNNKNRELILTNEYKSVICKICGEKMFVLSNTHLNKHNISGYEYKLKYGGKIMNPVLSKITGERLGKYNKDGSTKGKPSKQEVEILNLLTSWGIKYKSGDRKLLNGKEIDILIKDNMVGIEYNGNIHHTDWFGGKDKNYHLDKTVKSNNCGYGLIHIFSDEWLNNKDIIIHKLMHLLGVSDSIKIGGRKCIIKEIQTEIKNEFLDTYHIQGRDSSTVKLGAFYDDILVGVMTFKIKDSKTYELTRFATNYSYSISGLGSKMLKFFINNYKPSNIISFADRRWTLNAHDNLYTKLGFKLVKILNPDYKYFHSKDKSQLRYHKFGFRKNILIKKYPNLLNISMTETEMVKKLGYDRIWDCGLFKYELALT